MKQTIIINGVEHIIQNWTESPLVRPAGWSPEAEDAHNAEMARMGMNVLKPGQASFVCDSKIEVGTEFALKADGRRFRVIGTSGEKYVAQFSP